MGHIKLRNVVFRFDGRQVNSLEDISLEVEPGECVLLAGRSGSGKTTLLHCLSGLIPEYYQGGLYGCIRIGTGEVSWREVPLWQKAATVGTVFQDPRHQFFSARVEQELLLSPAPTNRSEEEQLEQLDNILSRLELFDMRHRLLDSLSSGEQQRVAICTAMYLAPQILVLDEPAANLSAGGIIALKEFLRKAKAQGTTIVIAEHRFTWLREIADQLVVLDKGSVAYQGSTGKLDDQDFCKQFGLRRDDTGEQEKQSPEVSSSVKNGKTPVFTLDGLGFRHNKQQDWLWQRLNRDFHSEEVVALTGKNGCGKTTLLGVIFGLLKPSQGMVDFSKEKTVKAMALQHSDLQLFASTVAREISSVPDEQEEWLSRFNLLHLKDRHPLTLSGGEMQRLVLATAFAEVDKKPGAILLLDEPTSGMDGEQLRNLTREIQNLQTQGISIVMATHDSELIRESGAATMELS